VGLRAGKDKCVLYLWAPFCFAYFCCMVATLLGIDYLSVLPLFHAPLEKEGA
jgi:hypothetical protein